MRDACVEQLASFKRPGSIWAIAVDGWKQLIVENAKSRAVGRDETDYGFTSPTPEKINELFHKTIGIKKASNKWYWRRQSAQRSEDQLRALIRLRGKIVHRVSTSQPIQRVEASRGRQLIARLAERTDATLRDYLESLTGQDPW